MKKILLISPFPPAQNPRLVKEFYCLKANGYETKVLFAERDAWASKNVKLDVDFIRVAGKHGSPLYNFTRAFLKISKLFLPFQYTYNRVSLWLYLRALLCKADLYIAHNLAALPIAVKAAKLHKTKCGFDAEDFHRQEVNDNIHSKEYKLAKYLEDKYLPQVDYITAASPLIAAEYKQLYPQLSPVVINNVFSSPTQNLPSFQNLEGLRLFWFSQTIGKGRGLEDVIKAMGTLQNPNIELTLLGKNSSESTAYFKNLAFENGLKESQLKFIAPVVPDEIFSIASQYHIGLALELDTPLNRNICLTNKIFTYIISGLAIIASETRAQKQLIQTYIGIGKSYQIGSVERLAEIIYYYYSNKDELTKSRKAAYELAKIELNWEHESKYFLSEIKRVIE